MAYAAALHKAFHPDKGAYGAYGDTGCHLHIHYRDEVEWVGVFAINPGNVYLFDEQYAARIAQIQACL